MGRPVKNGIIEYLDAEEEENAYIALSFDQIKPDNTHVEIATYTILGYLCINNPLSRAQSVTTQLVPGSYG